MNATASSPARILVIDDEPQIRRFLEISLRAQGHAVVEAASGRAGLAELAAHGADLVVLDLGLPDIDGQQVLRELRQWTQVPVIVLSVRAAESEKVRALDAGANDYLTKPFGTEELMARVRAQLRGRSSDDAAPVYDDGHLRVDLALRQVAVDGRVLALSRKEYALLAALVRHPGRVLTQPQLLREIWGPDHAGDTHYLRVLAAKLRQKLGEDAARPRYLETEPGVGLRFRAQAADA